MSLLNRTFPAPLHVDISSGALNRLHDVISDPRIAPDSRVAVIISTGSGLAFRAQIEKQIPHADFFELSDGSLQSAKDIAASLTKYSSVVGVGGGRVLDAAKFAASQANLPMIAVATNLAHDGIASPVSILEHDGTRSSHGVSVPAGVLIDLDVVRSGPVRFLRAGIGDVLSNLNAVADWELAREVNGEEVDGLAASMSRTAANSLLNHPGSIDDLDFLTTLAEGLVLSGLAMAVAGTSRPCSGACHEISHAIDMVLPEKSAPHGEQVAVGALFATYLRDATSEFNQLHDTLFRHGLPTSPKDLGLTTEQFAQAVAFAPQTRPDRFTILEHRNLDQTELMRVVSNFVAAL